LPSTWQAFGSNLLAPPRRAVAALFCSYIKKGTGSEPKLADGTQLIFLINFGGTLV
jgi:hypothetical protein